MPAAAVIPALIAYIKVVAVKKLVVGLCGLGVQRGRESMQIVLPSGRRPQGRIRQPLPIFNLKNSCGRITWGPLNWGFSWLQNSRTFYLEQIRVFKASNFRLNSLAWNDGIGLWGPVSLVFKGKGKTFSVGPE